LLMNCRKMFPSCQFNSVYHKIYNIIIIIDENYNKNIPPLQSGRLNITTLRKLNFYCCKFVLALIDWQLVRLKLMIVVVHSYKQRIKWDYLQNYFICYPSDTQKFSNRGRYKFKWIKFKNFHVQFATASVDMVRLFLNRVSSYANIKFISTLLSALWHFEIFKTILQREQSDYPPD
jgi:hypothetical protein